MSRLSGGDIRGMMKACGNVYTNVNNVILEQTTKELRESFFSWLNENKDILPEGIDVDIKELYAIYLLDIGYISEQPMTPEQARIAQANRYRQQLSQQPLNYSQQGIRPLQTTGNASITGTPTQRPTAPTPSLGDLRTAAARATMTGPSREAQALMSPRAKALMGQQRLQAGVQAQQGVEAMKSSMPSSSSTPLPTPNAAWAKANPKLAAAYAERQRIRGTAQSDNPLLDKMGLRSGMQVTPTVQSPTLQKDLGNLAKNYTSLTQNPNAGTPTPAPITINKQLPGPEIKTTVGQQPRITTTPVVTPPPIPLNKNLPGKEINTKLRNKMTKNEINDGGMRPEPLF